MRRELSGRVLELVRSTGVFGETTAFVQDEYLRARLVQWPVAVVLSEVYSIRGEPRLIEDLGLPDRRILANVHDTVMRNEEQIQQLWEVLKDWTVERRWDVQLPPGFHDPGKVQMFGTLYPTLDSSSEEGKRVWTRSKKIERDPKLRQQAKALNCEKNGGVFACEACGFSDPSSSIFDVHHLQPLAAGIRESRVDDLVVLCPTCHRWAHVKAEDKLSPLSVEDVAQVMRPALG